MVSESLNSSPVAYVLALEFYDTLAMGSSPTRPVVCNYYLLHFPSLVSSPTTNLSLSCKLLFDPPYCIQYHSCMFLIFYPTFLWAAVSNTFFQFKNMQFTPPPLSLVSLLLFCHRLPVCVYTCTRVRVRVCVPEFRIINQSTSFFHTAALTWPYNAAR